MPRRPLLQPRPRALPGVPHDRPSQGPSRCLCSRQPAFETDGDTFLFQIQCALVCTSCKTQRARVALNLGETKRARVALKGKTTRARRTEVKIHTNPARSRTDVLSHAESMQHPFAGSALGTGPACPRSDTAGSALPQCGHTTGSRAGVRHARAGAARARCADRGGEHQYKRRRVLMLRS
jgi:hypothetical protein